MNAYLQFSAGPNGPFQTVAVECRETEAPRSGRTVSGYGRKLPTSYQVKWEGRWRRVYVAQFGNAGSAYIGKPGAWVATVDIDRT